VNPTLYVAWNGEYDRRIGLTLPEEREERERREKREEREERERQRQKPFNADKSG